MTVHKRMMSFLLAGVLLLAAGLAPAHAEGAGYKAFYEVNGALLGLKTDGSAALISDEYAYDTGVIDEILTWTDIVQIDGSDYLYAGLRSDGSVVRTDTGRERECDSWQDIVQIAVAYDHVIGLRGDGSVLADGVCWPESWHDFLPQIREGQYDFSGWTGVEKLVRSRCAEGDFLFGIGADGSLRDTMEVDPARLGEDAPETYLWSGPAEHVKELVSSGWIHAALKEDGTVICKGTDSYGAGEILGRWEGITQIAIAAESVVVGLREDGTVVSDWEDAPLSAEEGWYDLKAVYGGENYLIGLRRDGSTIAVCPWDSYRDNKDPHTEEICSWTDLERISFVGPWVVGWKTDGSIVAIGFDPAALP